MAVFMFYMAVFSGICMIMGLIDIITEFFNW